ncbi:MAG: hypothetical protein RL618_959 [Pseudomonadota bacterium]
MHTRARLDGDGPVADIASHLGAVGQLDIAAGENITNDLATNADMLGADIAANFSGRTDDQPSVLAVRLLDIPIQAAVDANIFIDLQRSCQTGI